MKKSRLGWYLYQKACKSKAARDTIEKAYSGKRGHLSEEICCLRLELKNKQKKRSLIERIFSFKNPEIKAVLEKIYMAERQLLDLNRFVEARMNSAEKRALEIYEIDRSNRNSENAFRAERKREQLQFKRKRYIEHSSAVRSNQSAIRKIRIADEDPSGTGTICCFYCNAAVPVNKSHLDHRKPVASGGKNTRQNTVLTCPSCNLKKGKMTEGKFRLKIKEYLKL